MQTTMRISEANRDALYRIATRELGGVSLDEARRILLFEHQTQVAPARVAEDPDQAADYLNESAMLADVDVTVKE